MHTQDPHHNEYLAAIAGMQETYGTGWRDTGNTLPGVGDFVSGMTKGRRCSGHVQQVERGRMVVECDGAWLVVDPQDITH